MTPVSTHFSCIVGAAFLFACSGTSPPPLADAPVSVVAEAEPVPADVEHEPPPPPLTSGQFALPALEEARLGNGLLVYMLPISRVPTVTISLKLLGGRDLERPGSFGIRQLVGAMLRKGTLRLDETEISDRASELGGRVDSSAEAHALSITVSALGDRTAEAAALLSDIVLHPRMRPADFANVKALQQSSNAAADRNLDNVAWRAALRCFADRDGVPEARAYGHVPMETLAHVTLADVRRVHGQLLRTQGSYITVTGDFEPHEMVRTLEQSFGSLQLDRPEGARAERAPLAVEHEFNILPMPDTSMTRLVWLFPFAERSNPQYEAYAVAQRILGGSAGARLMMDLREARSLTYGIFASEDDDLYEPLMRIEVSVPAAKAPEAIEAVRSNLQRMCTELVSETELAAAKIAIEHGFVRWLESPSTVMWMHMLARNRHLPDDYIVQFMERVHHVTAEEARSAMCAISASREVLVAAGNVDSVRESYSVRQTVVTIEASASR